MMTKLKLSAIEHDKPVKLMVKLSAAVHRNLVAYADAIGSEGGQTAPEPAKLIAPMIERFMATDRVFAKLRKRMASRRPRLAIPASTSCHAEKMTIEDRQDRRNMAFIAK